MSYQDDVKERFLKFREKKYAIPVGLALALLLGILFVPFLGAICFGALIIAIIGFYVPYYFGLKDRRKLAVWGLVFVMVLAVFFTWLVGVNNVNAMEGVRLESSDGLLVDGTLEPYRGGADTVHNFQVTVTAPSTGDYNVNVIIHDWYTRQVIGNYTMSSAGLTADGERFEFATTLTEQSVFTYRFATNASGAWVHTFESYGPVHQSDVDRFTTLLPAYMIALLVQIGLLFYLLLAFSWFSQRSRDRMEEVMKERQQMAQGNDVGKQEESFVCSECGSDVPASAGRCPQCGESFEEDTQGAEKGKYECSECGATVDEGARSCWNCGKEFEE